MASSEGAFGGAGAAADSSGPASKKRKTGAAASAESMEPEPTGGRRYCSQKPVVMQPPPPDAASQPGKLAAIMTSNTTWIAGTTITWAFLVDATGTAGPHDAPRQRQAVADAWRVWAAVGMNLRFMQLDSKLAAKAMVRIRFDHDGSWSYVGPTCLQIPKNQATMNFGWDLRAQPGTAEHEIGHALGLQHEHQNPLSGIVWNTTKVIQYFSGPPNNWRLPQIRTNILDKITDALVPQSSRWDPKSIMEYAFDADLIRSPPPYNSTGIAYVSALSKMDVEVIRKVYPRPPPPAPKKLKEGKEVVLDGLAPGTESTIAFRAETSGMHIIEADEDADVVLTVTSAADDGAVQLDADNNAGKRRAAVVGFQAEAGEQYTIRVRSVWAPRGQMAIRASAAAAAPTAAPGAGQPAAAAVPRPRHGSAAAPSRKHAAAAAPRRKNAAAAAPRRKPAASGAGAPKGVVPPSGLGKRKRP